MPYKRTYKPRTRGNRYRAKTPSNKVLNQKIKKIQGRQEIGYKDTLLSLGTADMSGSGREVVSLGLVGTGDDNRARKGDVIWPTSLKFRGIFQFKPTTTGYSTAFFRLVVWIWDNPNGNIPTLTGTTDSLLLGSGLNAVVQNYNYEAVYSGTFKVLYDKVFTLTSQSSGDQADTTDPEELNNTPTAVSKYFKKTIKLHRNMVYKGNDAVAESILSNGIFFAVEYLSQGTDVEVLDQATFEGTCRMYYKDT